MSSNMKISKVCQFCDKPFIAKTSKTRYCTHRCNQRAYKARQKAQKILTSEKATEQHIQETQLVFTPQPSPPSQESLLEKNGKYLTVTEAYTYLKISRATLYRLIKNGQLKTKKINNRTFLKKSHLLSLYE
jgi:excisionase family DNA binding protein